MAEPDRTLSARDLNRATLARQMLLRRERVAAGDAIVRLAGLQAQVVVPPYVGLWTRLEGFEREELNELIADRRVVRSTLMRMTLHLFTADDYLRLRMTIQPAIDRAYKGFFGTRARGLDLEPAVAAARAHLAQESRPFGELTKLLAPLEPDRDPNVLAFGARARLPMVQTPTPGASWGYGNQPSWALPEDWLGRPVDEAEDRAELVRRYLAAFGPASVRDAQTWAGMTGLGDAVEAIRAELVSFRDEAGNELFDLPDAPRPGGDEPAPVRLLPEYDNLVLSHADRSRFVPEQQRKLVLQSAGRVSATFLVDGMVAGTWKLDRKKRELRIEPFARLKRADRSALLGEAKRVAEFLTAGRGSPAAVLMP